MQAGPTRKVSQPYQQPFAPEVDEAQQALLSSRQGAKATTKSNSGKLGLVRKTDAASQASVAGDTAASQKSALLESAEPGKFSIEDRRFLAREGNSQDLLGADEAMRQTAESAKRIKPKPEKQPLLPKQVSMPLRIITGLGTAGISEALPVAAKFARFAKGSDSAIRKLVTHPQVKAHVVDMLANGIKDPEIKAWLMTLGAQTCENAQ
jgi:hypothetical protein